MRCPLALFILSPILSPAIMLPSLLIEAYGRRMIKVKKKERLPTGFLDILHWPAVYFLRGE